MNECLGEYQRKNVEYKFHEVIIASVLSFKSWEEKRAAQSVMFVGGDSSASSTC